MTLEQYKELNLKKGTIHSIHWIKTLKKGDALKGFADGRITKETTCNFRIGVSYENMAVNKDKVTGSLPYGMWEYGNEIIHSITKENKESYQLRVTHTGRDIKPIVVWRLDGVEISKEELIAMNALGSSQKNSKPFTMESSPVRNINLADIIEIK